MVGQLRCRGVVGELGCRGVVGELGCRGVVGGADRYRMIDDANCRGTISGMDRIAAVSSPGRLARAVYLAPFSGMALNQSPLPVAPVLTAELVTLGGMVSRLGAVSHASQFG